MAAGKTQAQMMHALERVPSVYKLPVPKSGKRTFASISNWENAADNLPFSVQFRYAAFAGTYSGALHLVSLFYANFRDAADGVDAVNKLQLNREVARGLIGLGERVLELSGAKNTGPFTSGEGERDSIALIDGLLSAYREASAK